MPDERQGMLTYRSQRVWLDPETRIIMAEFDDGAELDIEDARASTRAMTEVSGGEERPLLVDFSNLKSQTKECREYYAKDPEHIKTYSAVALLVSSPLSRIIANFFLGINKPIKPTRLFEDRGAAVEWLKQYG
jgi:hypothetical protein